MIFLIRNNQKIPVFVCHFVSFTIHTILQVNIVLNKQYEIMRRQETQKKSELQMRIEPMTIHTLVGRSNR